MQNPLTIIKDKFNKLRIKTAQAVAFLVQSAITVGATGIVLALVAYVVDILDNNFTALSVAANISTQVQTALYNMATMLTVVGITLFLFYVVSLFTGFYSNSGKGTMA